MKTRLILLLSFICLAAWAQETRGTLAGRVVDPSGAVIPDAAVKASNLATGTAASGRTNESGNYIIPYLLPGIYRVEAERTGFKKFVHPNVEIRINDTVSLDIAMALGNTAETITVSESSPLLETATSSLGQVVDQKRILELPVGGGTPFQLVLLTPGVTNTTTIEFRDASSSNKSSSFSTNGSPNYSNEFTIDGVPNTYAGGSNPYVNYQPPSTAIAEFKVQTAVYDAALGHTPGGVINVATKSGTNALHGEAHEWFRDRNLDAPNFFQNRAGQTLPLYHYHRYGISAGGPLYLPKLYDGRNRTFFFYAYEANPRITPLPYTSTIPTPEQIRGDFSGLLALGSNYAVYDPATIQPAPNGRTSRSPFPGNIIPASRIDPLARTLSKYWPAPNQPGSADGKNNFYNGAQVSDNNYDTHLGRIDHTFSENHRIFLRTHVYDSKMEAYHDFQNEINGGVSTVWKKGASLDDVLVFSPTSLLNLRYGVSSSAFAGGPTSRGFDLAGLGFSKDYLRLSERGAMPNITLDGYTGFGSTRGIGWDSAGDRIIHSAAATYTRLQGTHSLRAGGEFRLYRTFNNSYGNTIAATISFSPTYTRGPLDNSPVAPAGQSVASYLLGIPTGGSMSRTHGGIAEQEWFTSYFIQDDWKITPTFTLNLGLRYEYETPITERFNRTVSQFDFGAVSPVDAAARAQYAVSPIPQVPVEQFRALGGLVHPGINGRPRTLWDSDKNNFMPRIGFAWNMAPKTVLRGGFGIFFETNGTNRNTSIQSGFSQSTSLTSSLDNGYTFVASLANPFPEGLLPALGSAYGLSTNLGSSATFFQRNLPNPYAQRWSLGIQRQLPGDFLLDLSYVGNKAVKLMISRAFDAVPAEYYSRLPYRDDAANNFLTAQVSNPFRGLLPGTSLNSDKIARSQLLRPYPQFTGISSEVPQGYSWYHSMQLRAEKRFSRGYTLNVAYTFSKSMEAVDFMNESDPVPYRSLSAYDRPHRLVVSGIYELPFGKGRRLASTVPGFLNHIIGGWQVNAIVTRQSGMALGFGNIIFYGDLKNIDLPADQRTVERWFNTEAGFERASNKQLVANLRTFPLRFGGIRSARQFYWDLSALKRFALHERVNLEFRAEAYNALNHPNFNAPNTTPSSSAFGQISSQDANPRQWQLSLKLAF